MPVKIFIGSSSQGREYAQVILEAVVQRRGYEVLPWWDAFPPGLTYIESLICLAEEVDGAVLVATPDDHRTMRTLEDFVIRNVLFQYGLFTGKFGRFRTALAVVGDAARLTNLEGVNEISLRVKEETQRWFEYRANFVDHKVHSWLETNFETRRASDSIAESKSLTGEVRQQSPSMTHQTIRAVFISSTSKDLEEHRAAVKDQIARRGLLFKGMEHFGADPNNQSPARRIVDEVRKADLYIGIFGVRYGSIDPATGLSMTELELNEAEAAGKPMLLYVIHDNAPVRAGDVEPTASGKAKLDALRARILKSYTPYLFTTVEDLARQVFEDLGKPASRPSG